MPDLGHQGPAGGPRHRETQARASLAGSARGRTRRADPPIQQAHLAGAAGLVAIFATLIVVMAVFTQSMHDRLACAITLFVWGIAAFATVPGLQMRVLHQASSAPNLASTLNIGAFNIGNALGAWLGGAALSHGAALDALPWLAALMTFAGVVLTVVAMWLEGRATRARAADARADSGTKSEGARRQHHL